MRIEKTAPSSRTSLTMMGIALAGCALIAAPAMVQAWPQEDGPSAAPPVAVAADNPFQSGNGGGDPFSGSGGNPFDSQETPVSTSAARSATANEVASSTTSKSEDELAEQLMAKLESTVVTMSVIGTPLREFAQMVSEQMEIPILIDYKALDDEGLDPDTEISWNVPNVRLKTMLDLTLGNLDMTYEIRDGIMILTTEANSQTDPTVRMYDCGTLAKSVGVTLKPGIIGVDIPDASPLPIRSIPLDDLIELIQETVEPLSWEVNGGPAGANVQVFRGKLVVRNTTSVHMKIRSLLKSLQ